MPAQTLATYVAALQQAEVVPRPENEQWSAMIERISVPATVAEIDEETYWYFLEVLPPKFMRQSLFAFAEGAEPLRIYWQRGQRYFSRQLTQEETVQFCRLAHILIPS